MNERIKKLIEECTFIYDDLVYNGTDSYMKTSEYFDKEKFAELLMKECADYVDSAISDGGVDGRSLKEHFGVGE